MATLAEELLNDFEDSGSEGEEEQQYDRADDLSTAVKDEMMDDEGEDEDQDMEDGEPLRSLDDADDEEEAKQKVDKLKLGGVADVRSVASLMKTLEPILEVR